MKVGRSHRMCENKGGSCRRQARFVVRRIDIVNWQLHAGQNVPYSQATILRCDETKETALDRQEQILLLPYNPDLAI